MARLQPVRGTHDILGDKSLRFRTIFEIFKSVAERYSHQEIDTPIFEFTETFKRTLGETSDVVNKEMYTFEDRGGEQVTLRPEYTAGIARAFMSNGLQQSMPCKFYSFGPIFRYERPQKGRMRQFHQMDVEIIGVPEAQADIEVLAIASDLLDALGIGQHITLELNSLGDPQSRAGYRDALVKYFGGYKNKLSEDSLKRLEKNPMRILDSKDEGDRLLIADAPRIAEYYNQDTKDFFAKVIDGIEAIGIEYQINDRLVRGLDYYCHTAFEFTTDQLGAQGTVLAGGRYDGLMEMMGGPKTAGVGWAAGMERLAELVSEDLISKPKRPVIVAPVGADAQVPAMKIAHDLRAAGLTVDMAYKGNVGKRMKRANKQNALFAVLIGEDEMGRGVAMVKNLDQGSQQEISLSELSTYILGSL
ncbi:MAG: histidine--tRNA ligase [Kordiimonadaceae bacterium]|nr:histidine--tRNA ligase [Kordiimonadaceae bacterium]MBT6035512.1 histidine--tRNA ligase [Kordiimonadaceae bacterium]MBT6328794.1 histidine--tRNA ligase [Kordiimonadaceae bacterium]MBT7581720.1 histidine--tRNA ligase [Kordiimonadaceae bacterium]